MDEAADLAEVSSGEGRHGRLVGEIERQGPDRGSLAPGRQPGGERLRLIGRGAVGEGHVMAGRDQRADHARADALGPACHENMHGRQAGSAAKTRQVFCPPKPKELESTRRTSASRATFGTTSSGMFGSGSR